jgi:hypothetical protein
MKKRVYYLPIVLIIILLAGFTLNLVIASPLLGTGAPSVISYQGVVKDSGTPYDGTGYFKFAVVNGAGNISYWSNDGTSSGGGEPTAGVSLTVTDGLFHVLLGDLSLSNMTSLPAPVFNGTERYLRVWFSSDDVTYTLLTPDQQFAAVPYALQAEEADIANSLSLMGPGSGLDADTVDGLHASELETHYESVVIVALSGGDYTSVQSAIDSITGESSSNPFLVWIAPGTYNESVTLKSHVHLQGAGQGATIISSTVTNGSPIASQGTLKLASNTSVRDLTVENLGTGGFNVAILGNGGIINADVSDVTSEATGSGTNNYAIFLHGSGTEVVLHRITALGKNGSNNNYGLLNSSNVSAELYAGSFTGNGGSDTHGILNIGTMVLVDVTSLGENGTGLNHGMRISSTGTTEIRGGSFTARDGTWAYGIYSSGTLEGDNVVILAEDASSFNYGLWNTTGTSYLFQSEVGGSSNSVNNDSGSTTITHSRLLNSANNASGTLSCILVTRGSTISTDGSTCP